MPDTVDTVIWAPDGGWRYHPKHAEQFAYINKLYIVASCWTIIDKHSTYSRRTNSYQPLGRGGSHSLLRLTYLLTAWCRVLLEKLTGLQLVKKFPAFHGTRRFITALTSVRHLSQSSASPIQSTYPHPTFWRSILILSTHLRLGLPSGLFTSGFPTKKLYY